MGIISSKIYESCQMQDDGSTTLDEWLYYSNKAVYFAYYIKKSALLWPPNDQNGLIFIEIYIRKQAK